jgi:NDP-sugar pyrophosphorylase family protein
MRAYDITGSFWFDVDTKEDLEKAESLLQDLQFHFMGKR